MVIPYADNPLGGSIALGQLLGQAGQNFAQGMSDRRKQDMQAQEMQAQQAAAKAKRGGDYVTVLGNAMKVPTAKDAKAMYTFAVQAYGDDIKEPQHQAALTMLGLEDPQRRGVAQQQLDSMRDLPDEQKAAMLEEMIRDPAGTTTKLNELVTKREAEARLGRTEGRLQGTADLAQRREQRVAGQTNVIRWTAEEPDENGNMVSREHWGRYNKSTGQLVETGAPGSAQPTGGGGQAQPDRVQLQPEGAPAAPTTTTKNIQPPTVEQGKAANAYGQMLQGYRAAKKFEAANPEYLGSMKNALDAITAPIAKDSPGGISIMGVRIPGGAALDNFTTVLGDFMRTPEGHQFEANWMPVVNAVMRRESGAQVNASEWAMAFRTMIPRPGDDAKTVEQKDKRMQMYLSGAELQAGPLAARMKKEVDDLEGPELKKLAPEAETTARTLADKVRSGTATPEERTKLKAMLKAKGINVAD